MQSRLIEEVQMRIVEFNIKAPSSKYEVLIGERIDEFENALFERTLGKKALIMTDDGAAKAALEPLRAMLSRGGITHFTHFVGIGECTKSFDSLIGVLSALSENGFSRNDLIINLGGGVVGDLGGFAASVYMRGIDYINLPTTFLSMIDSAMGGKTGIDFMGIKNNIGAFHQPRLVLCAAELLKTLPQRELLSGFGEVFKYYCISGNEGLLDSMRTRLPSTELIAECCRIKREHVANDVLDSGKRRILNLGHTFGHAFEAASGFSLTHGEAVVLGVAAAERLAVKLGLIEPRTLLSVEALASSLGFKTDHSAYSCHALDFIRHDKKSVSDSVEMVFFSDFGRPFLKHVPFAALSGYLYGSCQGE